MENQNRKTISSAVVKNGTAYAYSFIGMVVLIAATTSCYTISQNGPNFRHSYYRDTLYVNSFSHILLEQLSPNLIIRHDSLIFDSDSIVLRDSRQSTLDELLAMLYANDTLVIRVLGHTSVGPGVNNEYANIIADSRASYVRDFLVDNLIDSNRVLISSYDSDAIDQGTYKHGDKHWRCVDIQIIEY